MTPRLAVVLLLLAVPGATMARAEEAPPYLADLLVFAETVGAITYLDGLCGDPDAEVWRIKMQGVIEAQDMEPADRSRTIDAYNRGFGTFASVHLSCTDQTRAVLERYLATAVGIADRIATRFGRAPKPEAEGGPPQASPDR